MVVDEAHDRRSRLSDTEERGLHAESDDECDQPGDLGANVELRSELAVLHGQREVGLDLSVPVRVASALDRANRVILAATAS